MTHLSGATSLITIAVPTPADAAAHELDAWDSTIADLNIALRDTAEARLASEHESRALETVEAGALLRIEGRNESERRARLTLTLNDSVAYLARRRALDDARMTLADATRRVSIARQRCALHRAALSASTMQAE